MMNHTYTASTNTAHVILHTTHWNQVRVQRSNLENGFGFHRCPFNSKFNDLLAASRKVTDSFLCGGSIIVHPHTHTHTHLSLEEVVGECNAVRKV